MLCLVNLLAEVVVHLVHLLQHFAAPGLLAHSETSLLCGHFQCHLKRAQVGQSCQIGDVQVGGHHGLKVNADKGHEILHTAYSHFAVGLLAAENFS